MYKRFCDRCGAEVDGGMAVSVIIPYTYRIYISGKGGTEVEFDLCSNCRNDLCTWINEVKK